MTEILPILLYFQATQNRLDQEAAVKEHEEEFILEMQRQMFAMKRSQEICKELNNGKKQSDQRATTKAKGRGRRLDRPQRKDGKRG